MLVPVEKDGFFKSTAETGLLVAESLTGLAMLSGAVDSAPPVQILVMALRNTRQSLEGCGCELIGGIEICIQENNSN